MKLINETTEQYGELFDHTSVLEMKNGTFKAIHIQNGEDNLDETDYEDGFTWYIDYEIKDFQSKPSTKDLSFDDGYGGELLCEDDFKEEHPTWESLIEEIAEMEDIEKNTIKTATLLRWEK